MRLDPADAAFLADALGRLPGADQANAPVTVDLNGRVAVRARASAGSAATELVLSRSGFVGAPVRVQTNREYLARAARLGFAEVEVVDAESPIACRDDGRAYAWQPLDTDSAIGPADDVTRIESGSQDPPAAGRPSDGHSRARTPANDDAGPVRQPEGVMGPAGGRPTAAQDPGSSGLTSLIGEAEALHQALSEARSRAGRLVIALKKHRRRERLVQATLASLRQLRLQDVAG